MKLKRNHLEYILFAFPLIMAVICIFAVSFGNHQAFPPIPMPQEFVGEYSYDGETWLRWTSDTDLDATDGDLTLRGHFLRDVAPGLTFCFYRNHIGAQISVNGDMAYADEIVLQTDVDNELFASMCAQEWVRFATPEIAAEDWIEIRLINPHRFGNRTAYNDFLSTLCVDTPNWSTLEQNLDAHGELFRITGGLLSIASLMLLGAAIAAAIVRVPVGGVLLKSGLLTLFAGGYVFFDTIDISFLSDLNVLNTYAKHLCMMLAVYCLEHYVSDFMSGNRRKTAKIAVFCSTVLNAVLIILSFTGMTVIFDTLFVWTVSQLLLSLIFIVCCILELWRGEKKWFMLLSAMLMFAAILIDIMGVGATIVWRSPCTKIVFVVLFVAHIIACGRGVVKNYKTSIRAASLEKELEESRIAIMLSQIKPHFLYNVLNAIYHLYRKEPETAQEAVSSFADYLRCNMLSIEKIEPISFREEYRHVQTYLSLEQIRFRDKLNVVFDVEVTDFKIPPLTIEPLVENAVKHGVTKKRGGGTVTITTRRQEDQYIVTVADDGVGFDIAHYMDDGKPHIGIRNVEERLKSMVNGTLTITSSPDGTTATVTVPAGDRQKR